MHPVYDHLVHLLLPWHHPLHQRRLEPQYLRRLGLVHRELLQFLLGHPEQWPIQAYQHLIKCLYHPELQ